MDVIICSLAYVTHMLGFEAAKLVPILIAWSSHAYAESLFSSLCFIMYLTGDVFMMFYDGKEGIEYMQLGIFFFMVGHILFAYELMLCFKITGKRFFRYVTPVAMVGLVFDLYCLPVLSDTMLWLLAAYINSFAIVIGVAASLNTVTILPLVSYITFAISDVLFLVIYLYGYHSYWLHQTMMFIYMGSMTALIRTAGILIRYRS